MSQTAGSILCIIAGGACFWFGLQRYRKGSATYKWPQAPGEILSSEVERQVSEDMDFRGIPSFHPKISYTYTVNGRNYTSDQVSILDHGTGDPKGHARKLVQKYRVNKKVKVYYNPQDSSDAILEPGISPGCYLMMISGLFFILVGFVL